MKKKKVLIVYQFIAEYRKAIFENIIKDENSEYYFACDTFGKENIKLVDTTFFNNKNFIKLKNHWFKNLLWQSNLIKEIFFRKYDTVIFLADPNFLSTWIASIICKIKGRKTLFWTHGFIRDNSAKSKLKLLFYKLADGILLYGNKAKENLMSHNISEDKLFPIYNSLDYSKHKFYREKLDYFSVDKSSMFKNPKLKQIIFIGRLTPQKKLNILIELVHELAKRDILINLLFVGDGEECKTLEELAYNTYNLKNQIYFYGKTYNEEEIAPLIMSSAVCISPGEIGLTAMHVLSYGIPVITHNDEFNQMPEYEAVIDGYSGKLYENNSFESLLDTVIDFFKNPINNVKANCIQVIESKYTPEVQVKLIREAINE